jgi:NADH-quinone oxidoreductase subunit G
LVNQEGRAQRFFQTFLPEGDVGESWRWLRELARALDSARSSAGDGTKPEGLASWQHLDDAIAATADAIPALRRLKDAAPPAGLRMVGQKIPRQPERFSGRTAMLAHLTVHEPPPPPDDDSALAFSMEGYRGGPVPSPLIPQFWAPGWNSNQALNKYQEEVGGPLREELPGVRLIEVGSAGGFWFTGIPRSFERKPDRWLLLPLPHVFGSDELSVRSPWIAERIPDPSLALHPSDGARLRVQADHRIGLMLQGTAYPVTVHLDPSTAPGTAGLSRVPLLSRVMLPDWINLREAIRIDRRAA